MKIFCVLIKNLSRKNEKVEDQKILLTWPMKNSQKQIVLIFNGSSRMFSAQISQVHLRMCSTSAGRVVGSIKEKKRASPVIEKPCKEGAANFKFFQPKLKLSHENLKESEGMLNSLTDIIQGHKLRLGLGDSHERRGHRVHREQSYSRRSRAKTAKSLPSLPMKDTNTSGQRTFGLDAAKVNEEHVEREKQRIRNLLKNRSRPFDFHF